MNVIIKTGFQSVNHDITFQPETLLNGKQLVSTHHVRHVKELRTNNQSCLIQAHIIRQTSTALTPYESSLNVIILAIS